MTKSLTSYDILNIPADCPQNDIHAAYRALAKQWHPDRHHGGDMQRANHHFKLLQEAYNTLKTEEARSQYNHALARQNRAIMVNQNKVINDNAPLKGLFAVLDTLFKSGSQSNQHQKN